MIAASVIRDLQAMLPASAVLSVREDVAPYASDGLSAYRCQPGVVVLPDTEAQVIAILRLCHAAAVPVIARGAGTGLSGGALPREDAVLLGLAKFNQILRLDPLARTARVQPGVRNLAISEAAAPHGLYYAPDPSSQIACSIGGNVAENSGGVHCLKYGLTVNNVMRVRAVTMDGEVLELGGEALDSPGYDLLALMHGSEGMLAVITEVTVKLLAKPERAQVVLAAFDRIETRRCCGERHHRRRHPAGGPGDDGQTRDRGSGSFRPRRLSARRRSHSAGGSGRHATRRCPTMCCACMTSSPPAARPKSAPPITTSERLKFWAGRKNAFPAVGRLSPDYYCMDGTIPRRALPAVLAGIADLSAQYGLRVANVFHAGDGNLHPLILYDANTPGELEKTEALGAKILELCVAQGGTITGEHGVGVEKIDQMCVQFRPLELQAFHAVKAAFDPLGLLNPGKAVPTLHRCAELGAMHVHGGQLPHPELPRF